ncbi:hypothetical protein [Pseudoalteromonas sp. SW0106-04]|uniref:hypothetical protein n=1 Tax=Pseudoalteromonas sp. SW0106-04 TaxID=1702169 RepID=UPI0006B4B96F|nr:hypothetical protein [Pseudoalteromonas sp. SW0106-04]
MHTLYAVSAIVLLMMQLWSSSSVNWELTLAVAIKRQESFYEQAVQRSPIILIAEEYPYPDEVYSALKALNADIVTRSYY